LNSDSYYVGEPICPPTDEALEISAVQELVTTIPGDRHLLARVTNPPATGSKEIISPSVI
jgi:hypothetical protein